MPLAGALTSTTPDLRPMNRRLGDSVNVVLPLSHFWVSFAKVVPTSLPIQKRSALWHPGSSSHGSKIRPPFLAHQKRTARTLLPIRAGCGLRSSHRWRGSYRSLGRLLPNEGRHSYHHCRSTRGWDGEHQRHDRSPSI